MYYGKMWLVVRPSIGLPLFFGGVMFTSLTVHTAILTNTTWFPAFLNGSAKPKVAVASAAAPAAAPTAQINVAPAPVAAPAAAVAPSVIINVAPGAAAPK